MYCPTKLHDATSKHDSLESLQNYWKSILEKTKKGNRKYKLVFTGGEVTVNKNFKPFIVWLNKNYKNEIWSTVIVTNGSASLKPNSSMSTSWMNIGIKTGSNIMLKF